MTNRDAPFLGILALDTVFPRIRGDVGNPATYPMPVRIRVVEGAGAERIVADAPPPPALAEAFRDAARALKRDGARLVVSTCGFLVHLQDEVAGAVRVPVMLSPLPLWPVLRRAAGGRPVGILTASRAALGPRTLRAAGLPPEAAAFVAGMEDEPAFRDAFLAPKAQQACTLEEGRIEAAAVARARALQDRWPDTAGLILECGNLPPYAPAIRRATGLPVHHLPGVVRLLWDGAEPEA